MVDKRTCRLKALIYVYYALKLQDKIYHLKDKLYK